VDPQSNGMFGFRTGKIDGWKNGTATYEARECAAHCPYAPRHSRRRIPLHFVHRPVSKPVFNPVDRLDSGAAGSEFYGTYGPSIIPLIPEAVQPKVALAWGLGGHRLHCRSDPSWSSLAAVSLSGCAPARAVFDAAAKPPGAAPQRDQ
jgi:hypothetical protein